MAERPRVVFCGKSVFMTALEASLRDRQALEILLLDASLPDLGQRLEGACPSAIVVDISPPNTQSVLPILRQHPGLPVIGVDLTRNVVTVLTCREYATRTMADLAEVLETEAGCSIEAGGSRSENATEP